MAEHVGTPLTVAIGGGICIAGGLILAARLPVLRPEGRRIIVALQMAGGEPPEKVNQGERREVPNRKMMTFVYNISNRRIDMKPSSVMALSLFLFAGAVPNASAQFVRDNDRRQGDRVCFYQDANYVGWEQCYAVGDEGTSLGSRNSNASSIRFFGRARIQVWEETGFRGSATEFDADVRDLSLRAAPGGHTWNDRIRSFRVISDNGRSGVAPNPPPNPPPVAVLRDGVCVYERANYQGREQCWRLGDEVNDVGRRAGLNNRISSVRVLGDAVAVFYQETGFRGATLVVDRDIPDLARVRVNGALRTWNDQISSVRVEEERGRGRGRGRR